MMWGYGPDSGMMGFGYGGSGLVGMIIWVIILIVIIAGVVWLVRSVSQSGGGQLHLPRRSSGLDVLEERYARGEINREEYLQKKRDLE